MSTIAVDSTATEPVATSSVTQKQTTVAATSQDENKNVNQAGENGTRAAGKSGRRNRRPRGGKRTSADGAADASATAETTQATDAAPKARRGGRRGRGRKSSTEDAGDAKAATGTNTRPARKTRNSPDGIIRVASGSSPKHVARYLVTRLTDEEKKEAFVHVSSIRPPSVNQAVKAIAIARTMLKENGQDLRIYPTLRERQVFGMDLKVVLAKATAEVDAKDNEDQEQLKIKRDTAPVGVAGAIAKKVRAGSKFVDLLAIGSQSVTRAVASVANAVQYLQDDKMALSFQPEFFEVRFDEETTASAMRIRVHPETYTDNLKDLVTYRPKRAKSSEDGADAAAATTTADDM